jgi:diketogulonate reductase-like aldo/keto reductase
MSNRREFLTGSTGLAMLAGWPALASAQELMPRRPIPASNEMLPVIGLGSTKPVRQIATDGPEPLADVLRMLLEHGGKLVDTAPRTEAIDAEFGKLLDAAEFRDQLFLTAKINAPGEDAGTAQWRQTQRLFRRRTVDLLQVENMTDLATHWPNLRRWQEAGEARYIGVTVAHEDHYDALETFMRRESPDFVQLNYSVMETLAEQRLLPLAIDSGTAILVNGPFMNGDYFRLVADRKLPAWAAEFDCASWAQFSLKYILGNPAVTCVLTETTNPVHMRENLGAAFGRLPDANMRSRMLDVAKAMI